MICIIIFILLYAIIFNHIHAISVKNNLETAHFTTVFPLITAGLGTLIFYVFILIGMSNFCDVEIYEKTYYISNVDGGFIHFIDTDTDEYVLNIGTEEDVIIKKINSGKTIKELGSDENKLIIKCKKYAYPEYAKSLFLLYDREEEQNYTLCLKERVVE